MSQRLAEARAAYDDGEWDRAQELFSTLDDEGVLEPDDLHSLGEISTITGRLPEVPSHFERAYQGHLDAGDETAALRALFWAAMTYVNLGNIAQAKTTLTKLTEHVDPETADPTVLGYASLLQGRMADAAGKHDVADDLLKKCFELIDKADDPDLTALTKFAAGRIFIDRGEVEEGLRFLDEGLDSITRRPASPLVQGFTYCGSIAAFRAVFDYRRAAEWTEALYRWVVPQGGRFMFRGQCQIFRSELRQMKGDWDAALQEILASVDELNAPYPNFFLADAHYHLGELHRLRGDLTGAEEAYNKANAFLLPQPGLALLRLGEGKVDAAKSSIATALDGASSVADRAKYLPAYVEVMIAAEDLAAASDGVEQLGQVAETLSSEFLKAAAGRAQGALLLAGGGARECLSKLRQAMQGFMELEAPYEAARTRVLIAKACRELGDDETCQMELEAARAVFERLGAEPDLKAVGVPRAPGSDGTGLTGRELEVLGLIAKGKTNKAVASELFIAEKTVARHVSNIFTKIGVSSRAEATAYAYEHGLT